MDLACFGPSNFVKTSPEGKDENKTSKNMKFNFGFTKKVRVPEKKLENRAFIQGTNFNSAG